MRGCRKSSVTIVPDTGRSVKCWTRIREILDLVHQDLKKLSQGDRKGRKGDFTSENILRALIVQDMEGLPFREAVIRIGSDEFLQGFVRMRKKAVMDFALPGQVLPGHPPGDLETGERTAGPVWRGAGEWSIPG